MTDTSPDEVSKLATAIRVVLLMHRQPPQYAMKEPHREVDAAVATQNVLLLRCYLKSIEEQCGIVGGHFIYGELTARGYSPEVIEQLVVKWRIDLRKELLGAMQNIPGVMGENGIPKGAVDCIVMAYAAEDENKALEMATVIKNRRISDPAHLTEAMSLMREHNSAIAEGTL